jgi:hypothetical protein
MPPILAIAAVWLALDLVLMAGWYTAHVVARRSASPIGGATPEPSMVGRTTYGPNRTGSERRQRVVAAGTTRS